MISVKNIINELVQNNSSLFKSFLPNSNYDFKFQGNKNFKKFQTVIIIGMGGSILGAKAIYSFLKYKIKKKFIFIDNLDQAFLNKIKKKNNMSKTLFLIISKSGNTNETIINLSYFKSFLKKTNTIVISENKKNFLSSFARNRGLTFIKHNQSIGGRYSIFSEVGMLPAYLMGLNPLNFKKNLPKLLNNGKFLSNTEKKISKLNVKKYKTLILLNYVPELKDFLFWCQQLLAESLGKNKKGFLPVISTAPKDHHSLLQLYLDGPRDKIFYVFSSKKKNNLKINSNFLGENMKHLNKKNYHDIKMSQKDAFIESLRKKKNSFKEIIVKKFNEDTLGKLFLSFILETIILGKIMNVNPYDQPAVEEVKVLTKKILTSKKF